MAPWNSFPIRPSRCETPPGSGAATFWCNPNRGQSTGPRIVGPPAYRRPTRVRPGLIAQGLLCPFDDLVGDVAELAVLVLRGSPQRVEGGIRGTPVGRHDDALGLFDRSPGLHGRLELRG